MMRGFSFSISIIHSTIITTGVVAIDIRLYLKLLKYMSYAEETVQVDLVN